MRLRAVVALILLLALVPAPGYGQPRQLQADSSLDIGRWQALLGQPHVEGELLVRLRPGLSAASRPAALQDARTLETIPALGIIRYRIDGDLATALARLNADPAVAFAEPNYLLFPDFDPDDPYYVNYAANNSVPNGGYLNRMHMSQAWDITTGRSEIVVAVIDSGIDLDHEDLAGALWQNNDEIPANGLDDDQNGFVDDIYGWNFAGNDANVDDWLGHGSHVAGIIAARMNNGLGIAGIAPKTRVMAVGIFAPPGFGTFADLVKALLYATDNGASIINLSLGGTAYSRGEEMAVEYAVRHGVTVIAAAGNNGENVYHWPAAHPSAIAVGAVTAQDAPAWFTNTGDFVDLVAPGVNIWSLRFGGGYTTKSGTSMATPHVSGLAALILSRNPTLSPAEIRTILETTATDLGPIGRDDLFGYGRIDARAALEATPPYTGTFPSFTPDWLHQAVWPDFCIPLITDGDFETPLGTSWTLTGTAAITTTVSATGDHALFLAGAPQQQGAASQTFTIPTTADATTLAFALRVDNEDFDFGSDPTFPGRDHLSAWLRTADGQPLFELLRAGNADFYVASGLPWDRYLHVLTADELDALKQNGPVQLWFYADNGPDERPTRFFVDDVRFCAGSHPTFLPRILTAPPPP
ncbi:MAG: hypothetical protein D6775_03115 [Caldilineae bacterium]|nr:MAG: hypothetical protein D6775_03115 [Caldilineae bacterium]